MVSEGAVSVSPPAGAVWTLLVDGGRQLAFVPAPGNVLVSSVYVDAFGVTEEWFDAVCSQVPGAERWESSRGRRGWKGVNEWRRPPD